MGGSRYLDLSDNAIVTIDVPELPMFFSIARNPALFMEANLLNNALRKGSSLDFMGVDFVNSRAEPKMLFARGVFKTTPFLSTFNQSHGYLAFFWLTLRALTFWVSILTIIRRRKNLTFRRVSI